MTMFRTHRALLLACLTVANVATSARAQGGYPYPNSPGYPANLWLWPGSTIEGDIDRGMGIYLMGAGVYNYDSAWANAINWETARREIEYLEMCHRMQARIYALRKASEHERIEQFRKETVDRYRTAPTARDVESGNALNLAYWDLSAAIGYLQKSREAPVSIPSALVKQLPLQYAPEAITFQLGSVTPDRVPQPPRARVGGVGCEPFHKYVGELNDLPVTTLADLLRFMQLNHFQFAAARTPAERASMIRLYPALAKLRESVTQSLKAGTELSATTP
jgi:hypothetical protein